jgi:hypothetical protein
VRNASALVPLRLPPTAWAAVPPETGVRDPLAGSLIRRDPGAARQTMARAGTWGSGRRRAPDTAGPRSPVRSRGGPARLATVRVHVPLSWHVKGSRGPGEATRPPRPAGHGGDRVFPAAPRSPGPGNWHGSLAKSPGRDTGPGHWPGVLGRDTGTGHWDGTLARHLRGRGSIAASWLSIFTGGCGNMSRLKRQPLSGRLLPVAGQARELGCRTERPAGWVDRE